MGAVHDGRDDAGDASASHGSRGYQGINADADWSPDGTEIVFSRGRDGARNGDVEIYVMNADGSGIRPISNTPANDEEVDWR